MQINKYFSLLFLFLISACTGAKYFSNKIIQPVLEAKESDSLQRETDEIFSLLTYALVFHDWQPGSIPREKRRGYNIGALLINPQNEPVFFGLNSINSTNNATQHGEVRAVMGYLDKIQKFNLEGFTIYTTLEPCIMCAGMITMTSIKRVVYGQHDVEYSKAFERLAIDTRSIGGFPPYPRKVIDQASDSKFCKQLDDAYQKFLQQDKEKILALFLTTDAAQSIFKSATDEFLNYQVKNPQNKKPYETALNFYKSLK